MIVFRILTALSLLIAAPAFASSKIDVIKNNTEVKSAIAAFEANRSEKCAAIDKSNVHVSAQGSVKVVVSCNQYDAQGEPEANVYFITIRGALYPTFFEMNSVSIQGME